MTEVVAGHGHGWEAPLPDTAEQAATGMTRAQARHWRRMARVEAAGTPAARLHEAWRLLTAVVHGHDDAQDAAAEVIVTLAVSTATERRTNPAGQA